MGSVWRAARADGQFEGDVAIKFVHASWLGREGEQRFRREGRLLAKLDHPNIARLIDAGVLEDGQPYLTLEYVEGTPIDVYCDTAPVGVAARVRLFIDVLAAVAHAHTHLVVHRDIKPSNILVTPAGSPKLLDFGIARPLEEDGAALTRSSVGALTPDYAAPEQLVGGAITTATDIYALGLVLYRLLTRRHPFPRDSKSTVDYLRGRVETDVPPASTTVSDPTTRRALEGDLDNILAKALRRQPAERYATADAFSDDLERFLVHEPVRARPDTVAYRVGKFVRRHRGSVTAAALMLCAIIVASFITTAQMIEAQRQRDRAETELERARAFNDLLAIVLSESGADAGLTPVELLNRGESLVRSEFGATPALRARLMFSLATLYLQAGATQKEHELEQEAHDLAERSRDTLMVASTGCSLARGEAQTGDVVPARQHVQHYLAALPASPDADDARVNCLIAASYVESRSTNGEEALRYAEEADRTQRRSSTATEWDRLRTMIVLAGAQNSAGKLVRASETYQEVADGFARLNVEHTAVASTLYNNWAILLTNIGQPRRAAVLAARVVANDEQFGDHDAYANVVYAGTLMPLERYDEARRVLEPAYGYAAANKNSSAAAMVHLGLAAAYRELGDLDRSRSMLEQVDGELHAMGLPDGHEAYGALRLNRALLEQRRGDLRAALRELDSALAIFEARPGLARRAALAYLIRAEVGLAAGELAQARGDAERGFGLFERLIDPGAESYFLGYAWLTRARVLSAAGDGVGARSAAQSAYRHLVATVGEQTSLTVAARDLGGEQ